MTNRTNPLQGTCRHCQRQIVTDRDGVWTDPEATGDDAVWQYVCDAHDTLMAEHEPGPHVLLAQVERMLADLGPDASQSSLDDLASIRAAMQWPIIDEDECSSFLLWMLDDLAS